MDNLVTISADFSKMQEQIAELQSCFLEGVPNEFIGDITSLFSDIVLGEPTTTLGADKITRYLFCPRFGSHFENLLTTLRANKIVFHNSPHKNDLFTDIIADKKCG